MVVFGFFARLVKPLGFTMLFAQDFGLDPMDMTADRVASGRNRMPRPFCREPALRELHSRQVGHFFSAESLTRMLIS